MCTAYRWRCQLTTENDDGHSCSLKSWPDRFSCGKKKMKKIQPCSLDSLPSITPTKGSRARAQSPVVDCPGMPPSSDTSLLRKSRTVKMSLLCRELPLIVFREISPPLVVPRHHPTMLTSLPPPKTEQHCMHRREKPNVHQVLSRQIILFYFLLRIAVWSTG
jgi:hypothetical protein